MIIKGGRFLPRPKCVGLDGQPSDRLRRYVFARRNQAVEAIAPCLVQEIGRISPAVFQQPVPVIIGDGIDPIQGITNCLRQPVVDGRGPELTCRGATGDDEEKGLVEAAIREAAFKPNIHAAKLRVEMFPALMGYFARLFFDQIERVASLMSGESTERIFARLQNPAAEPGIRDKISSIQEEDQNLQ